MNSQILVCAGAWEWDQRRVGTSGRLSAGDDRARNDDDDGSGAAAVAAVESSRRCRAEALRPAWRSGARSRLERRAGVRVMVVRSLLLLLLLLLLFNQREHTRAGS